MSETRKIEFGKYYDLPLRRKVGLTGYYILCAAMSPFIIGLMAIMMAVILTIMIVLSPIVILWMLVAEIWLPPLEDPSVQPTKSD